MSMTDEHGTEVPHEEMERSADILRYDREELLRLQGALGDLQQDEWWAQLLKDLGPEVVEELQELQAVPDTSQQFSRRRSKNSERRQRSKAKREALHSLSTNALGSDKDELEECENSVGDTLDTRSLRKFNENTGGRRHVGKGSRNYDPYYIEDLPEAESFQPQAFAVEGEPDFESGPPEDGWEYLRRVKYEAARCPKVVVAQIDPTKLVSEQTPYMPEIPEIPACPSDLIPSKEWENHFMADFSLLRMALSNIRVPPTFGAERIPSLRNKAGWEVRCFGSITSLQDEDSKEVDAGTTEEIAAEPGDEERATQTETPSLSSVGSARTEIHRVANETRTELVDGEKFLELLDAQIDSLSNMESPESSYVIDLGLVTDYAPVYEPEESFSESAYFISGEPAEGDADTEAWKAAFVSSGISQPEDGPLPSADSDWQISNLMESGQVEGSPFGIMTQFEHISIRGPEEQHDDDEGMKPLSSLPIRVYTESDQLKTADPVGPIGAHAHTVQAEVDSCTGIETRTAHLLSTDGKDAEGGILSTQSSSNFEIVEHGDARLESADLKKSLDGDDAWALDEVEFGELYSGIDSQFDSLTIIDSDAVKGEMECVLPSFSDTAEFEDVHLPTGDYPDVAEGEMEVKLPSFSDTEFPEFEDAYLPTAHFMDSQIGLEIYRSGNVLMDEPESADINNEFKIDEPLVDLFDKVFQLVGVSQLPFVHLLLRLDEVSRAALFRHHVSWLENVNGLPKDRALWLLALSAVVDVPLDSQTSAAFRAMLRHCSGIRALKQSREDEDLYQLNVLITVAGVYFGQAEAALL